MPTGRLSWFRHRPRTWKSGSFFKGHRRGGIGGWSRKFNITTRPSRRTAQEGYNWKFYINSTFNFQHPLYVCFTLVSPWGNEKMHLTAQYNQNV